MLRLPCALSLVVVLLVLSGCSGDSDRPELADAGGTVTYNGMPLSHGQLAFHPENGRSASATIKDGTIVDPTTYELGDGLPIGKLTVTVSAVDNPEADMYTPTNSIIPKRYSDPIQSRLEVEIKPGENMLVLELMD